MQPRTLCDGGQNHGRNEWAMFLPFTCTALEAPGPGLPTPMGKDQRGTRISNYVLFRWVWGKRHAMWNSGSHVI